MTSGGILQHLRKSAERYPRLTHEDEVVLGRDIQRWQQYPLGADNAPSSIKRRGKASLDKFVLANQRLAIHLALRYADRTPVPLEDLVMAAIEGLITAYQRFDPSLGYRSSSYATWYAVSRLQSLCHEMGTPLRLTGATYARLRKIERASEEFSRKHHRPPTSSELADATSLTLEQVQEVQQARIACNPLAIDGTSEASDGAPPRGCVSPDRLSAMAANGDQCAPLDALDRQQSHARLRDVVSSHPDLDPRGRHILEHRYLSDAPRSLTAIALELNLTRDKARTLEAQALNLLRTAIH